MKIPEFFVAKHTVKSQHPCNQAKKLPFLREIDTSNCERYESEKHNWKSLSEIPMPFVGPIIVSPRRKKIES